MVADGTAPIIPQATEGASFEPSVRKKQFQKVSVIKFVIVRLTNNYIKTYDLDRLV